MPLWSSLACLAADLRAWSCTDTSTGSAAAGGASELGVLLARVQQATGLTVGVPAKSARVDPGRWDDVARAARAAADLLEYYSGSQGIGPLARVRLRGTSLTDLLSVLGAAATLQVDAPNAASPASSAPYDNTENAKFRDVAGRTHCTFAGSSLSWSPERVIDPYDRDDQAQLARSLRGFSRAVRREPLACFVVTLAPELGSTVGELAATTNTVLRALTRADGLGRGFGDPGRATWQFLFHGEPYFVLALGTCYPFDHARHIFGVDRAMLVLQPDTAFERVVSPTSHGLISPAVRRTIRRRYADSGRAYDLVHTESRVEAHRFVKPVRHGTPPVRWWETAPIQRVGA